jgi:hypothetical protein
MKDAFILYISAYNTASPLLIYTTSLHTDPYFKRNKSFQRYENKEVCFIKAKEYTKNTLHIIKLAFVDKKETLNKVPLISSCFDELKAILRINDFLTS